MSVSDDFLSYVLEQISGVAALRPKRMFGAVGLYSDEHFFAVIDDDMLYLKTDATTCAEYEARGMRRFMPSPGQPKGSMAYHEVPADVLEDRDELLIWACRSVAVGAASSARKRQRASPSGKARKPPPRRAKR